MMRQRLGEFKLIDLLNSRNASNRRMIELKFNSIRFPSRTRPPPRAIYSAAVTSRRFACPKFFPAPLPLFLVSFHRFAAGVVQPFLGDGGGPLAVGTSFDGFKADEQIAFTRARVCRRAATRRPTLKSE